jgi:flagellum-specific peptidoglycan hydrolase FlgJ
MPGFFVKEKDLQEAQSMGFRSRSKSLIDTFTEQLKAPPEPAPEPVVPDLPPVPESAPLSSLEWDRGIDTGVPTASPTRSTGGFETQPETSATPPSSWQNLTSTPSTPSTPSAPPPVSGEQPRVSGLPSFAELTAKWTQKPVVDPATGASAQDGPTSFLPSLEDLAGKWMTRKPATEPATATSGSGVTGQEAGILQPLQNLWQPRRQDTQATPVPGAAPGAAPGPAAPAGDLPPIDTSSADAFIRTATPYAKRAEALTGIPAALTMAVAANESGWGRHTQGNNFFGIQAQEGEAGTPYTDYRPDGTPYQARLKSFADPTEAFAGFGRFLLENPRYAGAIEQYKKSGNPEELATGISAAGYNEGRLEGPWSGQIRALIRQITPQMAAAPDAPAAPGPATVKAQPTGVADGPGWRQRWADGLTPNQIEETKALGLDWDTQIATCGVAGAIALARATGGNPSFGETLALAEQMGEWNKDVGMVNGFAGELRLLKRLGVDARAEGIDERKIAQTVSAGAPVVVNATGSGGHYYVAQDYDPATGRFNWGNSAGILTRAGGRTWFRLDELPALGVGSPANALYLNTA